MSFDGFQDISNRKEKKKTKIVEDFLNKCLYLKIFLAEST